MKSQQKPPFSYGFPMVFPAKTTIFQINKLLGESQKPLRLAVSRTFLALFRAHRWMRTLELGQLAAFQQNETNLK